MEPKNVTVKIFKKEKGQWPDIKAKGTSDEIKARRHRAIEQKEIEDARAIEDKKEKRRQDDDYVFHKQWDLEKDEKRTIEHLAAEHKKEAERDLYAWADSAEGRDDGDLDAIEVKTYFDKQLVEGGELEVKDGMIPLPGTYHQKTARSAVKESALSKGPRPEFDIRDSVRASQKKVVKKSQEEEEEAREDEINRREREREEEANKFREDRRIAEFERTRDEGESRKKEEEKREAEGVSKEGAEREEEERKGRVRQEERWRGEQLRKIKEYEENKKYKALKVPKACDRDDGDNDDANSDSNQELPNKKALKSDEDFVGRKKQALQEKEGDEKRNNVHAELTDGEKDKLRKKELTEEMKKHRTGASVNRWESERIAAEERVLGDAYYKVIFHHTENKNVFTCLDTSVPLSSGYVYVRVRVYRYLCVHQCVCACIGAYVHSVVCKVVCFC